jgi:hypothetical protein
VGLFRKEKKDEYDRNEILEAGEKAEGKGDRGRAIAEYEKVLEWEPKNSSSTRKSRRCSGRPAVPRPAASSPHARAVALAARGRDGEVAG